MEKSSEPNFRSLLLRISIGLLLPALVIAVPYWLNELARTSKKNHDSLMAQADKLRDRITQPGKLQVADLTKQERAEICNAWLDLNAFYCAKAGARPADCLPRIINELIVEYEWNKEHAIEYARISLLVVKDASIKHPEIKDLLSWTDAGDLEPKKLACVKSAETEFVADPIEAKSAGAPTQGSSKYYDKTEQP